MKTQQVIQLKVYNLKNITLEFLVIRIFMLKSQNDDEIKCFHIAVHVTCETVETALCCPSPGIYVDEIGDAFF